MDFFNKISYLLFTSLLKSVLIYPFSKRPAKFILSGLIFLLYL